MNSQLEDVSKESNTFRVLMVEDNPGDARLVQETLNEVENTQFELQWVKSLSEVREALENTKFDGILLDLSLPDSHGLKTIKSVHKCAPKIPIVVLTGLNDETVGLTAVQEGAQDYLVKGQFDPNMLFRVINYAIQRKKSEEEIKQIADEWEITFNSISDLISIQDLDGNIIKVNQTYADTFNKKREEFAGMTCYRLVHGRDKPCKECPVIKTIETKKPAYVELFEPHLDIYISVATSPIFNQDGDVVSVVHVAKDISERKKVEEEIAESEKNFRNMFDTSSEGLHIIDVENGRFIENNQAMCDMFQYSKDEFCAISPISLVADEDKERQKESLDILMSGGKVINHEGIRVKKDGTKFHALISALPISWKGKKAIYGSVRDITPIKEYQEKLKAKNKEILEFTDIITHDLKKPLSTIKTVHSILNNKEICTLNSDGEETLSMGREAVEYMQEMLEDLLSCARLDAGTQSLEIEEIEIQDIIETVLQRLKLHIEEKSILIKQEYNGEKIRGDKKALTKVFMNLIGNAINYIGDASQPEIVINTSSNSNGEIECSIRDNGIGIPKDIQSDIFSKFKRGSNVAGASGTGLGLSIVKGIVEAHGGKIWLESNEGEGTVFNFTLPDK